MTADKPLNRERFENIVPLFLWIKKSVLRKNFWRRTKKFGIIASLLCLSWVAVLPKFGGAAFFCRHDKVFFFSCCSVFVYSAFCSKFIVLINAPLFPLHRTTFYTY